MNINLDREKTKFAAWRSALMVTGSVLLVGLAGCNSTPTTPTTSPQTTNTSTTTANNQTSTTSPQVTNTDTTSANNSDPSKRLIGQWQGKYEGKNVVMIFTPESKLFASVGGEKKVYELFYRLDTTTNPIHFDVFENFETLKKGEVTKTILEFTPEGQLRVQMEGTNPKTPRPTSFNAKATVLKKISDSTTPPQNLQTANPLNNQLQRAIQAEGKTYIGSLNRASQAYFLEKNSFTDDIDQLGIGISKETRNYSYSLVVIDAKKAVQTLGIAKRDDVKSYTGLTYVTSDKNNEAIPKAILCESDRPTTQKPTPPEVINNEAQCPTGYTQYRP
ncbi:type IV pilin-like G/H family protein [Pseudanabaena sp. PCC 6802]|uniref:type IV pilin-like G/H family protein n=1 Tax=Pseudanabaena sp. PCC 6802 TaxID=118173 RepID=UPI000348A95E|nr:type IV pilin-like G/H family protein [Pseudanabaena sp. PCC 6802]